MYSVLLRFFGSMGLAITLLISVALASVAGTLLKQHQPYQDYIVKFGPYWHEVFKTLGLYDIYGSLWFVGIVAFLVVSTSVCVCRNAPGVLRGLRNYRENIPAASLRAMSCRAEWDSDVDAERAFHGLCHFFKKAGYRIRARHTPQGATIAAITGSGNRLGYLLTHAAIVVICVGGLFDSQLPLKFRLMVGDLLIEKDNNARLADISDASILDGDHASFRAGVTIPEGETVNVAYINVADGYLVQKLPFAVEVEDFRVEHYRNGQPKDFASDLVIHDPHSDEVLRETIRVNHPLNYRGYTIYQASFGDGGSLLNLRAHGLGANHASMVLSGHVHDSLPVDDYGEPLILEFDDFRPFNVFPVDEDAAMDGVFVNRGPSLTYKLRREDGSAAEFVNYMEPVSIDGADYFLSGVRASPTEEFKYLYLPLDTDGSLESFLAFNKALDDADVIRRAAQTLAQREAPGETRERFIDTAQSLTELFLQGGFKTLGTKLEANIPPAMRPQLEETYMKVLHHVLEQVYLDMRGAVGNDAGTFDADELRFFQDAVLALAALPFYDSPFFLQLNRFELRQASGLQIAKAPGKYLVYAGFLMLTGGVFTLFYISYRRCWVILQSRGDATRLLFAGQANRNREQFSAAFRRMTDAIKETLG